MNTHIFRTTLVGTIFLAGCIPTLNPVYTEDDLVFESSVVGEWKQEKGETTWKFTRHGEKQYRLLFTDKSGQSARFIAHLARIDGTTFLDLSLEKPGIEGNAFHKYHLLPIHSVYMVKKLEPQMQLTTIDLRWLNDYLESHPNSIQHATQGNRKLITASTKELQAFLLKHKDKFTAEINLKRQ